MLVVGLLARLTVWSSEALSPHWAVSFYCSHSSQVRVRECLFLFTQGLSQLAQECPRVTAMLSYMGEKEAVGVGVVGQLCVCLLLRYFSAVSRVECGGGREVGERGVREEECKSKKREEEVDDICEEKSSVKESVDCCVDSGKTCQRENIVEEQEPQEEEGVLPDTATLYWLSPVSVVSSVTSPLPGLSHALLLITIAVAHHSTSLFSSSIYVFLCGCVLVPLWPDTFSLVLLLLLYTTYKSHNNSMKCLHYSFICVLCGIITSWGLSSLCNDLALQIPSIVPILNTNIKTEYSPGFGVMW